MHVETTPPSEGLRQCPVCETQLLERGCARCRVRFETVLLTRHELVLEVEANLGRGIASYRARVDVALLYDAATDREVLRLDKRVGLAWIPVHYAGTYARVRRLARAVFEGLARHPAKEPAS